MGNVRGTRNRRIGVSDDDALCQSVTQLVSRWMAMTSMYVAYIA